MTRTLTGAVIAALATAALATPVALARPADVPPSAARSADAVTFPTRPVLDRPSAPPSAPRQTEVPAVADDGPAWPAILAGVAAILLAAGVLSTIASRARGAGRASVS